MRWSWALASSLYRIGAKVHTIFGEDMIDPFVLFKFVAFVCHESLSVDVSTISAEEYVGFVEDWPEDLTMVRRLMNWPNRVELRRNPLDYLNRLNSLIQLFFLCSTSNTQHPFLNFNENQGNRVLTRVQHSQHRTFLFIFVRIMERSV